MRKAKELPRPPADKAASVTYRQAMAVVCLRDGVASPEQQQMALQWILGQACAKLHFPYYQTDRDTAFALGRRFVADQITGLFTMDIQALRDQDEHSIQA